jgi:hypothetical protein
MLDRQRLYSMRESNNTTETMEVRRKTSVAEGVRLMSMILKDVIAVCCL